MLSKTCYLICLSLWLPLLARAEFLEFTHIARMVMGSRETQGDCREFAKVEARRAVLDQVGVYIETRSDLMQHINESAQGFSDSTDLQKRVLAIAAGVTQLEIVGEEWKSEGGALVLYLTCRVTVNPDDVALRLAELVKDRQKVEDYEQVQAEMARLREELAQLRSDLEQAKDEAQRNAARESIKSAINELSVNDLNIHQQKEYDRSNDKGNEKDYNYKILGKKPNTNIEKFTYFLLDNILYLVGAAIVLGIILRIMGVRLK